ncbi:MAG: hypothetical protein ABFC73_12855, partial [Clostridiaceae bacterium]
KTLYHESTYNSTKLFRPARFKPLFHTLKADENEPAEDALLCRDQAVFKRFYAQACITKTAETQTLYAVISYCELVFRSSILYAWENM